ncbi:MAG: HigA family addiction module antidote protein [Candidatus Eremiobacteraeota bacterium]|nr:HigA family addiction module antidote protein [Candidatus Eremiobacteraeota bacterium]
MKRLTPIHPGEILKEDFLEPMKLSGNRLAMDLHVPGTRINDILNSKRGITADTALRLARYFGTSAEFWMHLQSQYDLQVQADQHAETIKSQVSPSKEFAARA